MLRYGERRNSRLTRSAHQLINATLAMPRINRMRMAIHQFHSKLLPNAILKRRHKCVNLLLRGIAPHGHAKRAIRFIGRHAHGFEHMTWIQAMR